MTHRLGWATLGIALMMPFAAQAHAFNPGVLDVQEVGEERLEVTWRPPIPAPGGPSGGGLGLRATPRFPAECTEETIWRHRGERKFRLQCPPEARKGEIAIDGLEGLDEVDVVVRWQRGEGPPWTRVLRRGETGFRFPTGTLEWKDTLTTYFREGFDHILGGIDHLLFVFCLLLLVSGVGRLVGAITGFTLAHSITLGLSALGGLTWPSAPVEALIALSIVFLAAEGARPTPERPTLTLSHPWVVAFAFGLLHGFGFAGALTELGLPPSDAPLALLGFNLGVEAGQLAFVAVAFAPLAWIRRRVDDPQEWIRRIPSWCAGAVAAIWTAERFSVMFRA